MAAQALDADWTTLAGMAGAATGGGATGGAAIGGGAAGGAGCGLGMFKLRGMGASH